MERVLDAFRLSHERRGRVSYVSWLGARALNDGGGIGDKAMKALRRGWYLGEDGFKDKLLGLLKEAERKLRKEGSLAGDAIRAHNQVKAEHIIGELGHELGLSESPEELMLLKKGDPR